MKFPRPKTLSYQDTIRFHGHNGPFLALGYKLGRFLMKKFKPKGIMDFKITVQIKPKKPFTCIGDGLQCSTFATLGKGNISIKKSSGKRIIVHVKKGKKKYTFKITKKTIDMCLNAENLDSAAQKIFKIQAENLWEII